MLPVLIFYFVSTTVYIFFNGAIQFMIIIKNHLIDDTSSSSKISIIFLSDIDSVSIKYHTYFSENCGGNKIHLRQLLRVRKLI